ncbi:MAG: ABC transporter substrate-binding protein [Pseudomonadota bacterium]
MLTRLSHILLSALLVTTAWSGSARADISIGLSVPLEGSLSLLGRQAEAGARAAVEATNANGGINGEAVRLTVADDGCSAEDAANAARQLADADVVAVMGLLCFEAAFELRDNPAMSDVPLLSLAIRLPQFTLRGEPNFRFGAGPDAEADAITRAILELWDGKAFALADDGTVYGRSLAQAVRTKLELAGRAPQLTETYRPTQNVQTGLALRLANAGIQALFVAGDGEDVAVIAESLERRGVEMDILAGEAALAPFLPGSELTPPDGLFAVGAPRPEANPATEIIREQFAAAGIRAEGLVLTSYAATQTLLQALSDSSSSDLADRIRSRRASTILGPVSFNSDNEREGTDFIIYRYSGDGFSPVGQTAQNDG